MLRPMIALRTPSLLALLALSAAVLPVRAAANADVSPSLPGAPRPFSDYQVILDRKPFGDPAAKAPPQEERIVPIQESFAATLRLSGIDERDDGSIRVAITDRKDNSYFSLRLDEGENADGIELVEADYKKGEAVLKKGDEVVVLSMNDSENKVLSAEERGKRIEEAQSKRLSYAERRRLRQEARKKMIDEQLAQKPRLTGAELEEHLQNYQMEVLRTGLPPLPLQLTPDRDDQLVREGVLPPQDEEGYEVEEVEYEAPAGYDEYGPYYLDD